MYDHAKRRSSKRTGRERGCWVYIAAEELATCGYPSGNPPPKYRVWAAPKGRLRIQLYLTV